MDGKMPPEIEIVTSIKNKGFNVFWITPHNRNYNERIRLKFKPNKYYGIDINETKNYIYIIKYMIKKYKLVNTILEKEKVDLIICRRALTDILICLIIKYLYNINYIMQIENPIEQSWATLVRHGKGDFVHRLTYQIRQKLTYFAIKNSDGVLAISDLLREKLAQEFPYNKNIISLPEGVDIEDFSYDNNEFYTHQNGTIIYIGSIDCMRELDILIKSFGKVVKSNPNAKLVIVGDGDDLVNLKQLSSKLGIEKNIEFVGAVPFSDIPMHISRASIGISPIPPTYFYRQSSPIKLFEYMAMGRPVIASKGIGEHDIVIPSSNCGILSEHQIDSYADAMNYLLANPGEGILMGTNGKIWVSKNRTYDRISVDLIALIRRIASR